MLRIYLDITVRGQFEVLVSNILQNVLNTVVVRKQVYVNLRKTLTAFTTNKELQINSIWEGG